jgi:hypothetical protein
MAIGGLTCLLCVITGLPKLAVSVFPGWFPVTVVLLADVCGRRVPWLGTFSWCMAGQVAGTIRKIFAEILWLILSWSIVSVRQLFVVLGSEISGCLHCMYHCGLRNGTRLYN